MIGRFPIRYAVPAILLLAFLVYLAFFNSVMQPTSEGATQRLVRAQMMERTQVLQADLEHGLAASNGAVLDSLFFYASANPQSRGLFLVDGNGKIIKAHMARFEGGNIEQFNSDFKAGEAEKALNSKGIYLLEGSDNHYKAYAAVEAGEQHYILYMEDDYSLYAAEIARLTGIPKTIGAALLLFVIAVLSLLLHFTLTGRLKKITIAARALESGKKGVKTGVEGGDEIADLALVFDTMVVGIDAARSELEEARSESEYANRAKSDFLANMSHEIRTPLTGVLGMLEALKELKLSKDARRFAVLAKRSAHSLLDLINDILDFSRLEAGKKRIRVAPMNMANVVEGVHDTLAQQAIIKDLDLDCSEAMTTALWIEADEKALRQVLMNFINNAIKFSSKGTIKVTIKATDLPDKTDMLDLHVSVSDMGEGIEADDLERLFDRFEQVEEFKHSQKGTGLGLAICRELVALMKGKLWAESKVGVGSTFHFKVPVQKSVSYENVDTLRNVNISSFKRPLRVLAVDDNNINRTVIYQTVSGLGLKAFVAEDGATAIELVKRRLSRNLQPFDIILMDIHMPGLDGLDTMDRIRKLGDWAARIPIIALTAHAFSDQRAEFLERGMVGYVSKPIDRNLLALEIAKTSDHLNLLVHEKKKPPLKKKSSGRIIIRKK